MKKIIYIILAIVIIAGIAITTTIGLNVDLEYREHERIDINIGKETNIKDIKAIAKEVFGSQKVKVNQIDSFNESFCIETQSISEEQIENLKNKLKEKYELEDETVNEITSAYIPNLKLRDIIRPYIMSSTCMPIIIATGLILLFMGIRFKQLGSVKIVLQTVLMLALSEALLFSVIAITRYPVNKYVVPAGLTVYVATLVACNIQAVSEELPLKNKKEEVKE